MQLMDTGMVLLHVVSSSYDYYSVSPLNISLNILRRLMRCNNFTRNFEFIVYNINQTYLTSCGIEMEYLNFSQKFLVYFFVYN